MGNLSVPPPPTYYGRQLRRPVQTLFDQPVANKTYSDGKTRDKNNAERCAHRRDRRGRSSLQLRKNPIVSEGSVSQPEQRDPAKGNFDPLHLNHLLSFMTSILRRHLERAFDSRVPKPNEPKKTSPEKTHNEAKSENIDKINHESVLSMKTY